MTTGSRALTSPGMIRPYFGWSPKKAVRKPPEKAPPEEPSAAVGVLACEPS
jgi:hypothetical protein